MCNQNHEWHVACMAMNISTIVTVYYRGGCPKSMDNSIPWTISFDNACNSYTTGTSALPDIYAHAQRPQARGQVRIYRQSTSACGITNMFYFSMQTCGPQVCAYMSGKTLVPVI